MITHVHTILLLPLVLVDLVVGECLDSHFFAEDTRELDCHEYDSNDACGLYEEQSRILVHRYRNSNEYWIVYLQIRLGHTDIHRVLHVLRVWWWTNRTSLPRAYRLFLCSSQSVEAPRRSSESDILKNTTCHHLHR